MMPKSSVAATPSLRAKLQRFLAESVPLDWDTFRHLGAEPVPHHLKHWWWCLGGTPLYLFVVQVGTGVLLTLYYVPDPAGAYESVARITHEVRFGWYLRSLHKWSATLMIAAVFLHLLRVFFTGAYRYPRQLNWCVGVGLLGCTLGFGFTGYSLVYEQLSFWGATVAANLVEAMPLVGRAGALLMRGGPEVSGNTLTRFFIFHIGLLPTVMLVLLFAHVALIRLHGVTELQFPGDRVAPGERTFPFWPHHATTELLIGVLPMFVLTVLALALPAGLGAKADPAVTPAHIHPEWYFYFNFRLLKLTSLRTSVYLTMALGAGIFCWPFLEDALHRWLRIPRDVAVVLGVLTFLGFLVLTVWESLAG
jgi:quinol-cytochrome oxidoreductase complex cytochrome b subunit